MATARASARCCSGRRSTITCRPASPGRCRWRSSTPRATPGAYQAGLTVDRMAATEPFTVLIDPRVAAGGVTVADLKEQFDHNVRVRELGAAAQQLLARVRTAMTGADGDKAAKLRAIYE